LQRRLRPSSSSPLGIRHRARLPEPPIEVNEIGYRLSCAQAGMSLAAFPVGRIVRATSNSHNCHLLARALWRTTASCKTVA
jgi:hypothetical protein